ncbi:hypothetical protein [Anaerocolumna chitinilytica]|uniref:hypothetical protein n=1 Tax=Anaerocolumna chitinilytica TaxID=1727145 RepID=UPI00162A3191|nr:hypothetical protein [Anaerocolumna chitinilytica]
MNDKVNPNCPCPKTKCKYHGHCMECRKQHNGKPFCSSTGLKKRIADLLFNSSKTK